MTTDERPTKVDCSDDAAGPLVLDAVRDESSKDAPVRLVFEPKSSRIEQQELITALLALLGPFLNPLPLVLRTLVLTAVLVPLMTYVVMPRLTRLFTWWLYPSTSQPHREAGRRGRNKRR